MWVGTYILEEFAYDCIVKNDSKLRAFNSAKANLI